jgi:hypothetical protein
MRIIKKVEEMEKRMSKKIIVMEEWKRRCKKKEKIEKKKGKKIVKFMMIENMEMWVVKRMKRRKEELKKMKKKFYGVWEWNIIKKKKMKMVV